MTDLNRPKAYKYALATGDEAARRLALLHSVYGPDAERILESIGISQGNRVADFGCGTGATIPWFAKHVGSSGEVVGLDASAAQLATLGAVRSLARLILSVTRGNAAN